MRRTRVQQRWDSKLVGQPKPERVTEEQWHFFLMHIFHRLTFRSLAEFCGKSESYARECVVRVAVALEENAY
jgi:hypothetical protein